MLSRAFVLGRLAELAGEHRHPLTGRIFAEHWAAFDRAAHPLVPVELRED